ncbi:MAG: hypothetical protein ACI9EF_001321 [Pseudohongiellaceae bacterium]|jgi:hypothetical protein
MVAIGVDHVQFSVPDLSAAVALLTDRGWNVEFEQPRFAAGQRPYFREADKSMVYLKRGRDALELIDGSAVNGTGRWTAAFSGELPGSTALRGAEVGFFDASVGPSVYGQPLHVEALGGTCLRAEPATETAPEAGSGVLDLTEVLLRSSDPEGSCAFLELFGFRRDVGAEVSLRLVFPQSFLCMGLAVTIVAGPAVAGDDAVDDLGMSLVALISKDLEADRTALLAAGYETTDIFEYTINGRPIRNVITRGPGAELVELIAVGRAAHDQ